MAYTVPNTFATQSGNVPASQLDNNFTALAAGINNAFLVGTLAGRPAPDGVGNGRYYFATDDNGGTLYRDNGAAWVAVAPGAASAALATGSWTPAVGGTATYLSQAGSWVKFGKMVLISGSMQINVLGTGSNKQVTGLPWPVATTAIGSVYVQQIATAVVSCITIIAGGPDLITFYGLTAAGPNMVQLIPFFQNNTFIIFSGMYQTT